MAESCAPHSDGVSCELQTKNHPLCTGQRTPGDYVDWVNSDYRAPRTESKAKTIDKLSGMASKVSRPTRAGEKPLGGFAAGLEGSERAATRWDDNQKALVDDAIVMVAAKHAGGTFTSDDVWANLRGAVPVTKGLTARLMSAEREGTIENTGETAISDRGGEHDHGQRLTVWRSLA